MVLNYTSRAATCADNQAEKSLVNPALNQKLKSQFKSESELL